MARPLYLDTSAILRSTLEAGTTPEIEKRIGEAEALVTSRLAIVETSRALHRVGALGDVAATRLVDAERSLDSLWSRCAVFEVDDKVCDLAATLLPRSSLRTLDAIHLATFLLASRRLSDLDLLTTDERMSAAHSRLGREA